MAIYNVDNLPYSFENLVYYQKESLIEKLKDIALYEVIEYEEEREVWHNENINPPLEYIEAFEWCAALSDKEKEYIDKIVLWRNRPVVC